MKAMSDKELNLLVSNDREWRKFLITEIRELRKEQGETALTVNTLKVKVGFISAFIGFVAGIIGAKL